MPADVIVAAAPRNPQRPPHRVGRPKPAVIRIIDPTSIVVGRPRRQLVAGPVRTVIGPHPIAVAVGPPTRQYIRRIPASSVRWAVDPIAALRQRPIKHADLKAHADAGG